MAEVQIIGWDDDYRWEEERRRVIDCVKAIAERNGFAFALVQDMIMKTRYRGGSNCVNVQFRKKDWIREKGPRYVPARLYFNEDCDLASNKTPNPEWFAEVNQTFLCGALTEIIGAPFSDRWLRTFNKNRIGEQLV